MVDLSMASQSYYDNTSKRVRLGGGPQSLYIDFKHLLALPAAFCLISISCFRTCKIHFLVLLMSVRPY